MKLHENQIKIELLPTEDLDISDLLASINGAGTNFSWKIEDKKVVAYANWDVKNIKKVANSVLKTSLKTQSNASAQLIRDLRDNPHLIKISTKEENNTYTELILDAPFRYTKEDVRNMARSKRKDHSEQKKLRQRLNEIKNFILKDLCAGASKPMKDAVKEVWEEKIGHRMSDLENGSFFMAGEGWLKNIIGAMGEFQNAVFIHYLNRRFPRAGVSAELIGDQYNKYGQPRHDDMRICKAFGVQVKNYNLNKTTDITISLHPSQIGALVNDRELVTYFVNSYFNTDVPQIPEADWKVFFENHIEDLLNIDLMDLRVDEKVSFYVISGHLVPGSDLIQAIAINKTIQAHPWQQGKKGKSDKEYREETNSKDGAPLFADWWKVTGWDWTGDSRENFKWEPTEKNTLEAWEKYVSIKVRFNYTSLLNIGNQLY